MLLTRAGRSHPRHAVESSWHRVAKLISRRSLLVTVVVLAAGPLAWILPQSSSASQVAQQTVALTAPSPVALAPVVAIPVDDDLVADPEGVATSEPNRAADGALIGWPVTDHTPSTGFGFRSDPFTHLQRWHDGVDLGQPCGDPARASLDGTVQSAGWAGGYGNRIIVRHADRGGQSFATTYNHLSAIDVAVGGAVKQGDAIGKIGSTGRSTACHMHFEVILGGSYVDPMRFLTGDQAKAALSRRVGSYMPAGLPSTATPSASPTTPTPSPTTVSPTPTPTPTPKTPSPSPSVSPSSSPSESTPSSSPSPRVTTESPDPTPPSSPSGSPTEQPPSAGSSEPAATESSQASSSASS